MKGDIRRAKDPFGACPPSEFRTSQTAQWAVCASQDCLSDWACPERIRQKPLHFALHEALDEAGVGVAGGERLVLHDGVL
ncbi:MAG: hypothetical protein E6760_05220, partial [Eggerthella sp.]|nr:hypothetical protein [Eggerthella sp.]